MGSITEISVQKKNKNRCNIYIDNIFAFGVSNELIYKENYHMDVTGRQIKD